MNILKVTLLILILSLTGCQSIHEKASNRSLEIVNLKNAYIDFWSQAKGKDFNEQLEIWNKTVEAAYPQFYNQVIHDKENSKNWKRNKRKSAKKLFAEIPKIHQLIIKEFNTFDYRIKKQFLKFQKLFPDADFSDFKIIAAPSLLRFNGQSNEIDQKAVLAFGVDFLALLKVKSDAIPAMDYAHNADSFYGHELFHLYGESRLGISSKKIAVDDAKLVIALWAEGLATYVSTVLNPDATLAEQLMDHRLAKKCSLQLKDLKYKFRKDMRKPLYDPKDRSAYTKWFLLSSKDKTIPVRAGYCLGYYVAKDLSKIYTLHEMANWNFRIVQDKVFKYFDDLKDD